MENSGKKLVGTIAIVFIALADAVVSVSIASARLGDASGWVHFIYFFFCGVIWVLPAMAIIKWMHSKKPLRD